MKNIVAGKNPEFWSESKCPFYTLPNGAVSCYGDEVLTSLYSMANNSHTYAIEKVSKDISLKFGAPDSPYQIALNKRKEKKYPIEGPWINGGVIKFLENYDKSISPTGSSNCEDHDGLAIVLPWTIQSSDAVSFPWSNLKQGAEILSTNLMALQHYEVECSLLNAFLNPDQFPDPILQVKSMYSNVYPEIVDEIDKVEACKKDGMSTNEIVKKFGLACPLPGSFEGALASIIGAGSFVEAIRENIMAGGDSCSRGLLIGACLGAKFGLTGIPVDWMQKVLNIEDIIKAAKNIYV